MVKVKLVIRFSLVVLFSRLIIGSSDYDFNPADSFLIACGSSKNVSHQGRTFVPDSRQSLFLLRNAGNSFVATSNSRVPSPIYKSTRIFPAPASYEFYIRQKGRHWVRLYFHPIDASATMTVVTEEFVLLDRFTFKNYNPSYLFKEYVITVKSKKLTISFIPVGNSVAFVNGIEVVSAPEEVFSEQPLALSRSAPFRGLSDFALETVYRLNMGGPLLTPHNDTLGRTWQNDHKYINLRANTSAMSVAVNPATIKYVYPVIPQTAPNWVYATAVVMGDSAIPMWFFNITWKFPVDPYFTYFVRLHFCDIISDSIRQTFVFNVYINNNIALRNLDLAITEAVAVPYFQDFIINNSSAYSDTLTISMGPVSMAGITNATMSGLEIMKISNDARSLDGISSVESLLAKRSSEGKKTGRKIGLATGASVLVALMLLGSCFYLMLCSSKATRQENPWLAIFATIWKSSHNDKNSQIITSRTTRTIGYMPLTSSTIARFFSLQEIMDATNGFDESFLLGVGGFGRVYMGTLEDGTKVAVKRANPMSMQGPAEFRTEIKILSKVRHRHLVSLLGYCDENSEMILIYEYMANGTLRKHLYGSDLPTLPWKQRLKICIGAARGLHYLHTGADQSIIHRDVKTTNILLDENFVAKVADFGLSKIGPCTEQTHVSTVVKGTFGYFDPEYIRRQQLTAKSDVYSFGVLLMEVLCARPVLNEFLPSEEVYIVDWAMNLQRKGMLDQIIDPSLVEKVKVESLKKFSETAERCLEQNGADRPTMETVLSNLEYALLLEVNTTELTEPEGDSTITEGSIPDNNKIVPCVP